MLLSVGDRIPDDAPASAPLGAWRDLRGEFDAILVFFRHFT
jgi:hypothetical protein